VSPSSAPDIYWHGNVVTSLRLLDLMRAHGGHNLVFSSTAACYGEPTTVPITEDMPTAPTNPYGASKLSIDQIITSYAHAYGLGATSLRYFNVAGAYGDTGENRVVETHLIPLVLQVALDARDQIMVFGDDWPTPDGTCVRDYIHIRDLADAHLLAARPTLRRYPPHLQSRLRGRLQRPAGHRHLQGGHRSSHPRAQTAPRRAGDPATLIASSARAINELGWTPTR
jgi:UDP-glucose 4-epimerase